MEKTLAEKTKEQIFSKMEQSGITIPPALKQSIEREVNKITNYTPKVGVFGKTGVGKSSLCNALFGQDICSIGDVQACTRDTQEVLLTIGDSGTGIKLIDVPGVGESNKRDDEYDELYKNLLPELDLIFWVFKGDDRANASDEDFYNRLISPYINAGKPFLAVINQVDKIEPFREWNEEERAPSVKQLKNIKDKCSCVANFLQLPVNQIIPVSANERYGLMELVDAIVHALPNEQKAIVLHNIETAEDIRKKAAQEAADAARKEAEEAACKAEIAHKEALAAKEDERKEMEKRAKEADERCKEAEERAKSERKRAREESERTNISRESRREAEKSMGSRVLDIVEKIPVVGDVVRFFRSWF